MQKHTEEGVILACDFCGAEWDQVKPMIEGHKGSILCLACLARAVDEAADAPEAFTCTLCRQDKEAGTRGWRSGGAAVCYDCVQQADRAFAKDPDTEWDRKIAPDDRWR